MKVLLILFGAAGKHTCRCARQSVDKKCGDGVQDGKDVGEVHGETSRRMSVRMGECMSMWAGVSLEGLARASSGQSCHGAPTLMCAAGWHWKDKSSNGADSMALPQEPRFEESGTNRPETKHGARAHVQLASSIGHGHWCLLMLTLVAHAESFASLWCSLRLVCS